MEKGEQVCAVPRDGRPSLVPRSTQSILSYTLYVGSAVQPLGFLARSGQRPLPDCNSFSASPSLSWWMGRAEKQTATAARPSTNHGSRFGLLRFCAVPGFSCPHTSPPPRRPYHVLAGFSRIYFLPPIHSPELSPRRYRYEGLHQVDSPRNEIRPRRSPHEYTEGQQRCQVAPGTWYQVSIS